MSRPNSSDPQICLSEGGANRVAKLICAGSCGAIHGAKTANTIKQATKTQPIAASGLRLASRGSEITLVAIAEIADASLANYGSLAGSSMFRLKAPGTVHVDARNAGFYRGKSPPFRQFY
jgi:hypothetical protein